MNIFPICGSFISSELPARCLFVNRLICVNGNYGVKSRAYLLSRKMMFSFSLEDLLKTTAFSIIPNILTSKLEMNIVNTLHNTYICKCNPNITSWMLNLKLNLGSMQKSVALLR